MLLETSGGATGKEARKVRDYLGFRRTRILRISAVAFARIIRKIHKQRYVQELGEIAE